MARYRRYQRRGYYGGYRSKASIGQEIAAQHKREAAELSRELGGTDSDVKRYFFSLSHSSLSDILDEYENRYGASARQYAEITIPKWQSGERTMSGMVASRLFDLLPPRMPLAEKYKLTEGLWKHYGPSSKKRLRVGLDADPNAVCDAIRSHLDDVVVSYKIPEQLEARFNWLSAGDVSVKQQLLNHLRSQERALVAEGARLQLPVLTDHLRSDADGLTTRAAQMLRIGKHEIELLIDKSATGVALEDWAPPQRVSSSTSDNGGCSWIFWVIGAIVLYMIFAR